MTGRGCPERKASLPSRPLAATSIVNRLAAV